MSHSLAVCINRSQNKIKAVIISPVDFIEIQYLSKDKIHMSM